MKAISLSFLGLLLFSVVLVLPKSVSIPKESTDKVITLYRGVAHDHPMYSIAKLGGALPFGINAQGIVIGHSSPYKHNTGDTKSIFTSWTPNKLVAYDFATTDNKGHACNGIVLAREFALSTLIDLKQISAFRFEQEYLAKGIIKGARVYLVPENSLSTIK